MSEIPHNYTKGDDSPFTEHIMAARLEAGQQRRRPPNGDPVIAEFSRQYPAALLGRDALGSVLRIHWNREPLLLSGNASVGVPVSEKYGVHRMGFAYDAMFQEQDGPPIYEYDNPEHYHRLFENIRKDEDRLHMFRYIISHNVPTTDPKRYVPCLLYTSPSPRD